MDIPKNHSETGTTRRSFLDLILGVCGAIVGFAATLPALIYLLPVTKKSSVGQRALVEGAEDLMPWEAKTDTLAGQPVIVLRTEHRFVAYSAVCTHLGCIVHWNKSQKAFLCPCHAAKFDADGKVTAGPPPTPLRTYKVREADGKVYISQS